MEVAARVGLPMAGVNLPAHFMIRPQVGRQGAGGEGEGGGEVFYLWRNTVPSIPMIWYRHTEHYCRACSACVATCGSTLECLGK